MRQDEEFTPLHIMKKSLLDSNRSMYRVYKSPTEFVTVEAATALEALRESGIKTPYKIKREIRFQDRLMELERLTEADDVYETAIMGAVEGSARAQPDAGTKSEEQPKEVVKEAHELTQAPQNGETSEQDQLEPEPSPSPTVSEAEPEPQKETSPMPRLDADQPEGEAVENVDAEDDDSELSEEEIAKLLDSE